MFSKKIKLYSFSEFFSKNRTDNLEHKLSVIKRNKKFYFNLIILVAIGFISQDIMCEALGDTNINAIDTLGNKMLVVVRTVGYWYAVIMCSVDSIKASLAGSANTISSIVFKYSLLFATFYFVPTIFDLIKSAF